MLKQFGSFKINSNSFIRKKALLFTFFCFFIPSFLFITNSHAELTDNAIQLTLSIPPGDYIQRGDTSTQDQFTGTLSYNLPIEVPPGRKGMAPDLNLTYRSGNGNGWIGLGWELEVGSIERKTRLGLDYASADFVLRLPGYNVELVPISNGEYRAQIEGKFYRITPLTQGWEVQDKNGVIYLFGESSASRQDNPSNSAQIFKWCLDKVIDTNGNFMNFVYNKDITNGQIYLDRIEYSGNGSSLPTNYIKFNS
ncbi:MAG: hypothetical protein HYR79_04475 [Nitrospirae bacterium]|nr:hypothetical protein [Nitrospirota bacterium]